MSYGAPEPLKGRNVGGKGLEIRFRGLLVALGLMLCGCSDLNEESTSRKDVDGAQTPILVPLEVGSSSVLTLNPRQKNELHFVLKEGDPIRLEVDQLDFDLKVRILDPEKKSVLEFDGPYGQWAAERVAFVAPESGVFSLQIETVDGKGGDFRLRSLLPGPETEKMGAWPQAAKFFYGD